MGEDSRRGAPRSSPSGRPDRPAGSARPERSASRAASRRDPYPPRPGAQPGGGGQGGGRPGGASQGGQRKAASTDRLTSVIEPVLRAMEIDLEAVKVSSAGRRAVLRVVIDADGGVSLDDMAEVSRELSARLDAKNTMGDAPYTLEVTSPGVDRPLTQPRHWRRAAGRLVAVQPANQDQEVERDAPGARVEYRGRVVGADHDHVILEIDGARRTFSYGELGPGRVQVEFGRLDETDDVDDVDGADIDAIDVADDSWQGEDIADGGGPDEEEPDGH